MSKSAVVKSGLLPAQPSSAKPPEDQSFQLTPSAVGTSAWKQEVNERLAAHRTRRAGQQEEAEQSSDASTRSASSRAAEAAARVAARYAKAPSYKQLLAGEARAVVRAAGAAAEAARHAQAAAQAVLTGLEFGPDPVTPWEPEPSESQNKPARQAVEHINRTASSTTQQAAPARWQDEPPVNVPTAAELAWREYESLHGPQPFPPSGQAAGAKPRWEEDLPVSSTHTFEADEWAEMRLHPSPHGEEQYKRESFPLGGDVDRHDPILEATVQPAQPIAANLIEFPRELVAPRKARPRLAEGPFYDPAKENPQLNIFEVDPDQLAPPICLSATHNDVAPPEWASIQLDHPIQNAEELDEPVTAASWYAEERFQENAQSEPLYDLPDQAPYQSPYESAYEPLFLQSDARTEYAYSQKALADPNADPNLYSEEIDRSQTLPNSIATAQSVAEFARVAVSSIAAATASTTEMAAQVLGSKAAAWESIAELASNKDRESESELQTPLIVAQLKDRTLAGLVDGALVMLAFLAATVVVAASTSHPPAGRTALIASIFGLLLFGALYQLLFFTFAEGGTPGMRYARIALCTFDDDNPSREQMRKRIPAMLLSALPAGLGLAWALVDRDNLGLHDRLTRTYQRKY